MCPIPGVKKPWKPKVLQFKKAMVRDLGVILESVSEMDG